MSNEPQPPGVTDETVPRSGLSLDVAFEILANGRRRAVLSYLLEDERRADLEDLAAHVTTTVPTDADRPTAATLHHLHLPKLADAGLISYDHEQGTAVARDSIRDLEPYLEWARKRN